MTSARPVVLLVLAMACSGGAGGSGGSDAGQGSGADARDMADAAGPEGPWKGGKQLGSDNNDGADAIAVDGAGNVYLTGGTAGTLAGQTSAGSADGLLVKLTPGGRVAWQRQLGSDGNDNCGAVAIDGAGNVFVAGYAGNPVTPTNVLPGAFVAKYDSSGTRLWTAQIPSYGGLIGATTDAAGAVYVAGELRPGFDYGELGVAPVGFSDALVIKYDASGARQWLHIYHTHIDEGREAFRDIAFQTAMAKDGRLYLAGMTMSDEIPTHFLGFLARLDPQNGDIVWSRLSREDRDDFTLPIPGDNWMLALTTGADGEVYIGGSFDDRRPVVERYEGEGGARTWRKQLDFRTEDTGAVTGLAFDPGRRSLRVVGSTGGVRQNHNSNRSAVVIALDPDGNEQWRTSFVAAPSFLGAMNISVRGVAVNPAGNTFVAGATNGNFDGNVNLSTDRQGDDMYVEKIDRAGVKQ